MRPARNHPMSTLPTDAAEIRNGTRRTRGSRFPHASRWGPGCWLLACLAVGLRAQAPSGRPIISFHRNVGEVLLQVTVLGKHNRPLSHLPEQDFQIYENHVRQRIDSFQNTDAPVSAGLLIDNSGSMSNKRAAVIAAAHAFVQAGNRQDETFIVNFNDEYYLDAPFTRRMTILQRGLDRIESNGGTALYDAAIASLDYLVRHGKYQKKALLIITDGVDDVSRYTLEQTVRIAEQEKDAPLIYSIGILGHTDRGKAKRALKALAKATGGQAMFPKHLAQVPEMTALIAREMRQQYTLSYRSNQTSHGFRRIQIKVKGPHLGHVKVIARRGYYFPPEYRKKKKIQSR